MAVNLGELWKKGTTEPLAEDLVEGGLGIDISGKKAYSKASDGSIFEIGGTGTVSGVHNDLTGRDVADAHPTGAVTGLDTALAGKEPADANIQTHIADVAGNPHAVTAAEAGAEPENVNIQAHIADVTSNPHAVTAALVGASPTDHNHDTRYFQQTLFVDVSTGVAEGGSPVMLNAQGLIDVSMMDTSMFLLIGPFDPSAGIEYPDTTDLEHGSLWYINELVSPTDTDPEPYYTFVAGDLTGYNARLGDFMAWGVGGWTLMEGQMDPNLYYKLDGTSALTAPFAAGGQQLKNIADATEDSDAVAFGQVAPLLGDYVEIDGDTMEGNLDFATDVRLTMQDSVQSVKSLLYIDATDTVVINDSTLPVFTKGSWTFNLAPRSNAAPVDADHLIRKDYFEAQLEIGLY